MGIPRFYRWISERYPCLSEVVREAQVPPFDNLYLDMNGIIHNCSHPNDNDVHFRISEEEIFANVFRYTEFLFRIIKPRKVFFIAVDGVAPRAKMNQQRGRRFRAAKEAESKESEARKRGEVLPEEARFDSNCITPGTEFMVRLQEQLKYFITMKINNDETWRKPKIYLSGHETPGEGEHKIMDFIRYQKAQPDYDPYTRHCLYGLDADLIKLGMCSHELYFSLLREEVKFIRSNDKKMSKNVNPEAITFHLLHLSLLRDYLDLEFSPLKTSLSFEYNLKNIIDDWVLMGFLVGNDFIPHIPHFHINKNSLATLYEVYIKVLPQLDGYMNENGFLNLDRFKKFLTELAKVDRETFNENLADLKYFAGKHSKKSVGRTKKLEKYFDNDEDVIDDPLEVTENSNGEDQVEIISDDDCEIIDESPSCDESETDENELFEEEFRVHKKDYYETKLNYEKFDESVLREQACCYIRALQWNLHYYYNGCISWSWFYPHHYAPYISDIKDFENVDLNFELGEPLRPYEQLLAVLPAASKQFLPNAYQKLVTEKDSPLINYYPENFETDQNEKQQAWESVVLIPFIDEKILLNAANACYDKLSETEKKRNKHGPHLLFTYSEENLGFYPSSLLGVFPNIVNNHAKCEEIHQNAFRIKPKANNSKKNIKELVVIGFPTLKYVKFKASLEKLRIRVFEMPSQGSNMVLTIKDTCERDLEDIAAEYVGKFVYVNWPHLFESKVVKITDGETMYSLDNTCKTVKNTLTDKEKLDCARHIADKTESYKDRKGIIIGETKILLFVLPFAGYRYDTSPNGKLIIEKQWSNIEFAAPLQTVVKDIDVLDSFSEEFRHINDLFPIGQKCFVLKAPFYGEMAEVLAIDEITGKVKVRIFRSLQPDLSVVIKHQNDLINKEYCPNFIVAQKLNLNNHLVSRITGSIFVQRKKKNSKENIGLNLKFNSKNLEVPGYSKRKDEQWLFSKKAIDLLQDYIDKFPFIFENLVNISDKDIFELHDLFPFKNAEEKLDEVVAWLKSLPSFHTKRQKTSADVLDECIVRAIQDVVYSHNAFCEELQPVDHLFKPIYLFRPMHRSYTCLPDPTTKYKLFDRVVNIREGIPVPLGAKGIIIGRHIDESRNDNSIYDIVFDDEFVGAMSLQCSPGRGYKLPPASLINISYGNKSNETYGIISQSNNLRSIQTPVKRDGRENFDERRYVNHYAKQHQNRFNMPLNDMIPTLEFTSKNFRHNTSFSHSPHKINHSQHSPFESPKARRETPSNYVVSEADFPNLWTELQKMKMGKETQTRSKDAPKYSTIVSASKNDISKKEVFKPSASSEVIPPKQSRIEVADLFKTVAENSASVKIRSAREDLNQFSREKYGREPEYRITIMGPLQNKVGCVEMPDETMFTHTLSSDMSEDDAYESVAAKALRSLNVANRYLPPPSFFAKQTNKEKEISLPKPPCSWLQEETQTSINQRDFPIPESYVAFNQKLIDEHRKQSESRQTTSFQLVPKKSKGEIDLIQAQESLLNIPVRTTTNMSDIQKGTVPKARGNMPLNINASPFIPLQVTRMNQTHKQKPKESICAEDVLTPESIARNEAFQNNQMERKSINQSIESQRPGSTKRAKVSSKRMAANFPYAP
ncbi:exoribonuclease 1-like protein [Dinothrombium tinctorium]|uniref:5'-3' exoribonuclease 1 n=1 Tax=Dinothrombium tinctorium TaxID=1965070 RepID=A0A3S3NXE9_9ACAR|nr:exoribonuclease 1-like protein [Dinothrombium tinctorium]